MKPTIFWLTNIVGRGYCNIYRLRSTAGLFRVLALDSLRRRAASLPGLLDELRPELGRALAAPNDAIQSSALRLLVDLLPREPDNRAGARPLTKHCTQFLEYKSR